MKSRSIHWHKDLPIHLITSYDHYSFNRRVKIVSMVYSTCTDRNPRPDVLALVDGNSRGVVRGQPSVDVNFPADLGLPEYARGSRRRTDGVAQRVLEPSVPREPRTKTGRDGIVPEDVRRRLAPPDGRREQADLKFRQIEGLSH